MDPVKDALLALAAKHAPTAQPFAPDADAIAQLQAGASHRAILLARPTLHAPLIPVLHAARDALAEGGLLFVADLVWQTAPTPELMRAFAPPPGREKVRPVEGYEMQVEHAGFDIVERGEVDRARWSATLEPVQRAAVDADARVAARLATWVLR